MITVLLFARLREAVGQDRIEMEWNSDTGTVARLLDELHQRYPAVLLTNVMVAVNEQYADRGDFVPDGSTVALIPPVSGG